MSAMTLSGKFTVSWNLNKYLISFYLIYAPDTKSYYIKPHDIITSYTQLTNLTTEEDLGPVAPTSI